jgi:hypothetical protein
MLLLLSVISRSSGGPCEKHGTSRTSWQVDPEMFPMHLRFLQQIQWWIWSAKEPTTRSLPVVIIFNLYVHVARVCFWMKKQAHSKKMELDDLIKRRKLLKAEHVKSKEEQVGTVELIYSFADLAELLNFRDKENEIREY